MSVSCDTGKLKLSQIYIRKFVYLEKSQSTPGAVGGGEASFQIAQMLNLVFRKKVGVPFWIILIYCLFTTDI